MAQGQYGSLYGDGKSAVGTTETLPEGKPKKLTARKDGHTAQSGHSRAAAGEHTLWAIWANRAREMATRIKNDRRWISYGNRKLETI